MSSGLSLFAHKYRTTQRRQRVGDYGDLFSSAVSSIASVANAGIEAEQADSKSSASKADAVAKLAACVAADATATQANAIACSSALSHSASTVGDVAAANIATQAQDAAGAALPMDQIPARVKAAKKAVDDATAKWQATLRAKNQAGAGYAKCLVDAATATLNKASAQQIVNKVPDHAGRDTSSFWTDPLIGPLNGWQTVAGGSALAAIAWRLLRGRW